MCLWNTNAPATAIFRILWSWYLTLTDNLDFDTKERVLPQGIYMWNMKAVSVTTQKLWPMLKFLQTNKRTDGQTEKPKTDLSMRGHKNLVCCNSFSNKPWFLRVCGKSLLKTLWEKEKLLVTSNFSFSHSVFYPFGELSAIFMNFEIVRLPTLSVWRCLKFVVWERVQ